MKNVKNCICVLLWGLTIFGTSALDQKEENWPKQWRPQMLQTHTDYEPSQTREFEYDNAEDMMKDARNIIRRHISALDKAFEHILQVGEQHMAITGQQIQGSNARTNCSNLADPTAVRAAWRQFKETLRVNDEECALCSDLFVILKALACLVPYDPLKDALVSSCELVLTLAGRNTVMCDGIITLQFPYVFTSFFEAPAEEFCETLNFCFPPPDPNKLSVGERVERLLNSRPSPPQRETPKRRSSSKNRRQGTIKIIHLTDIHIQPMYLIGGFTDCNKYICCKEGDEGTKRARKWGEYRCNLPERTLDHMLKKVNDLNPDFIIYTGDSPPHTVWDETLESQLNCSYKVAHALKTIVPGKSVYTTLGNHEMFPTNIYTKRSSQTADTVEGLIDIWKDLANFGPDQNATMRHLGYYSLQEPSTSNLRILSLNTNHYWSYFNFMAPLTRNTTEEQEYRDFIINTLKEARENSTKVIVLSHYPLSSRSSIVRATRWWEEVALEYSDVIVFQLSGHTHMDEFHLIMDPVTDDAKSINFLAPSVTSNTNVNPSMKIYYLDETTKELVDYETYYMKLDEQVPDKPPDIERNYGAKEIYGLTDLSANSWKELSLLFVDNDILFEKFYSNRFAKALNENSTCTGECKMQRICEMWFPNYDEVFQCVEYWLAHPQTTKAPPIPTSPQTGRGNRQSSNVMTLFVVIFALGYDFLYDMI